MIRLARYWSWRMSVDDRSFFVKFFEKVKKGKNGKHAEWREFKQPKVLHVTVPAVAAKRPITRNF